ETRTAQVERLVVARVVAQVRAGAGDERRAPGRDGGAVGGNRVDVRVGVDAGTLKQIDQIFLDEVEVDTGPHAVRAGVPRDVVDHLIAAFIRVLWTRQEIRDADIDTAGHRGARSHRRVCFL